MAAVQLSPEQPSKTTGYLDTGCSVTLVDRAFLNGNYPDLPIREMASPITVRGLGSNKHETSEYIVTSLYFPSQDADMVMLAPREIHIVNNLKANLLIGIDIMVPEKIDILASQSKAVIGSCGMIIPIEVRTRAGRAILHPVYIKKSITVPLYS